MKRVLILLFLVVYTLQTTQAQREKYEAAYLYQFTKYIEWCPASKAGDFIIAVLGDSPLVAELQNMAQTKKVVNQVIVVKKISNVSDITEANVVIVCADKGHLLASVLGKISGKCSLLISEKEGAAKNGAAINFVETSGKIGFEINKGFFNEHNLSLSTQLTTLAKNVF